MKLWQTLLLSFRSISPPSSILIEVLVGHVSAPNDDCFTQLPLQLGVATSLNSGQEDGRKSIQWQFLGMFLRKQLAGDPCLVLFLHSAAHNRNAVILDYGDKFYTEKTEVWAGRALRTSGADLPYQTCTAYMREINSSVILFKPPIRWVSLLLIAESNTNGHRF